MHLFKLMRVYLHHNQILFSGTEGNVFKILLTL